MHHPTKTVLVHAHNKESFYYKYTHANTERQKDEDILLLLRCCSISLLHLFSFSDAPPSRATPNLISLISHKVRFISSFAHSISVKIFATDTRSS